MVQAKDISKIEVHHTLNEFIRWQPNDGFKYEWNDGEIIIFLGMKRKHLKLFQNLSNFLIRQKQKKRMEY